MKKLKAVNLEIATLEKQLIDKIITLQRYPTIAEFARNAVTWYLDEMEHEKKILEGSL